jgi:hypothetical protein
LFVDAVSTQVPLEVYLRSSGYEPDAEYVDGKVEERPMGEFDHSAWQLAIIKWFLRHEDYRTMGIPHIWVIDPEDSSFSRYEDSQLRREFFSDPARGITFEMNVIKGLLTRTSRS